MGWLRVLAFLVFCLVASAAQTLTGQAGAALGWWPPPFWPRDLIANWVGSVVGYGLLVGWLLWLDRRRD